MARSKPPSRKSIVPAAPAESHIDVASSDEAQEDQSGDEEVVEVAAPPKRTAKAAPTGPPPGATSSSKQSTVPQSRKSAALKPSSKPLSDDALHSRNPSSDAAMSGAAKEERRLRRMIEHLKGEVEMQEAQIEKANAIARQFEEQYDELVRSREVGPDPALLARVRELEEQVSMKGIEIGELRKIHESAQHLISDTGILHFTTKEAAQKDRKGFEKELVRLKKVNKELDDRNKALGAEKDKQCEVIEAELIATKQELAAEIERAKTLAAKPAGPRGIIGPGMSEANAATIALYEDITNVLIINVKFESSPYLGLTDKNFQCVCSIPDGKTLQFQLRIYHAPIPELTDEERENITSKDQLFQQCKYIPIDLDKEPDDAFKARLDFLGQAFTFAKDQMDVFAKTLIERLQAPSEESMIEESIFEGSIREGSEAGDSSVMEVEPQHR